MIEFTINKRCPSVYKVDEKLSKWRLYICEALKTKGYLSEIPFPLEDGIRKVVKQHLNGHCKWHFEFYIRSTERVTDLDNMGSFIYSCFRTEPSKRTKQLEASLNEFNINAKPWFFYSTFNYPGKLKTLEIEAQRYGGSQEDKTVVKIYRL